MINQALRSTGGIILAFGLVSVVFVQGATRAAAVPAADDLRQAVQRSTAYLQKEGLIWMRQQQCVSCHHIPAMIWALNEAHNRGYPIDEKARREVTAWALAPENQAKVFPDLPLDKKHTEPDYLGPLLMALGTGADKDRDAATEEARQRLLIRAAGQQNSDGSWHANSGGRPPIHATKDVQTSWLLLAMSEPIPVGSTQDPWSDRRQAAANWLAHNPSADSFQGLVMRLLVRQRLGVTPDDPSRLVELLLRRQNNDGGWSQTPQMESDAFATGLALYALSVQAPSGVGEAIRSGQTFLIRTQQPDGSWLMKSRHAEPTGPGPAGDLRPIRYFGSAWATIGLVCSTPANGAIQK